MRISLGDLIPIFIAIATIFAAYSSGMLDAKRMELAADKARFELETKEAEQLADETASKVRLLETRLEKSRSVVNTQGVLKDVAHKCETLEKCRANVNLLLDPPVLSLVIDGESNRREELIAIVSKLGEIAGDFKLASIKVKKIRLSESELSQIVNLQPVEIELVENKLTNIKLAPIAKLNRVKKLGLVSQKITNLRTIAQIDGLQSLTLNDLPSLPSQFDVTFSCAHSLNTISITQTAINDVDCVGFTQFESLKNLYIEQSQISYHGLKHLLENSSFDVAATVNDLTKDDVSLKEIVSFIDQLNREKSERRIVLIELIGEPDPQGGEGLEVSVQQARVLRTTNANEKKSD